MEVKPARFISLIGLALLCLDFHGSSFGSSFFSHGAVLPNTRTRSIHHRLRKAPSAGDDDDSLGEGLGLIGSPDIFFEVSRPVGGPEQPDCSVLVLQHAFANTYSLPPATATYSGPPALCGSGGGGNESDGRSEYTTIVLKWSGSCKGRQFDRISALWFGGVEILRTCTAEPTSRGVYWEVRKDVSRYSSLLMSPQNVVLELANVVDSTYTGVFYINVTLEFYRATSLRHQYSSSGTGAHEYIKNNININHHNGIDDDDEAGLLTLLKKKKKKKKAASSSDGHLIFPSDAGAAPADLVLPISNSDPISGQGHWFQISSENERASVVFRPPPNIVRAVLEVCISFHGNDEFWYTNPPNEYLEANGLSGDPGNGPFREVQVYLDGAMVGAAWPFPTVFTGGINPLFWRPAAAIGAFDLPTYDIELTPFIGLLVDGNNHTISMQVKNADGSWPLDANLHLWLDPQTSSPTSAALLSYDVPTLVLNETCAFQGLDGEFHSQAHRSISFSGYIISATFGHILMNVSYSFAFENAMAIYNNSGVQVVKQDIETTGEVVTVTSTASSSGIITDSSSQQATRSFFPLYLYCSIETSSSIDSLGTTAYTQTCNLTHSFNQEWRSSTTPSASASSASAHNVLWEDASFESVADWQAAQGSMDVVGSSVAAGVGALQQHYGYESAYHGCYTRGLSTMNYSILYDATNMSCASPSVVGKHLLM